MDLQPRELLFRCYCPQHSDETYSQNMLHGVYLVGLFYSPSKGLKRNLNVRRGSSDAIEMTVVKINMQPLPLTSL